MTITGRGDPADTGAVSTGVVRGKRQGSVSGRELLGFEPARRRRSPWRGIALVVVVVLAIIGGTLLAAGDSIRDGVFTLAQDNPQVLRLPFVGDVVKDRLGSALTAPSSDDDTPVKFEVLSGQSASEIGTSLHDQGFVSHPLVFAYHVMSRGLDDRLQAGVFTIQHDWTPRQIAVKLASGPDPAKVQVTVALRAGLRIEQIAAYLQTLPLEIDEDEFYRLASDPPAELRSRYAWLSELPRGRSLEGFLGAGFFFSVDQDITAERLLRILLDHWGADIGTDVIADARRKGVDFYEVLTIASIVERETAVDAERRKIAGVYVNRLDPSLNITRLLNADPTVIYAVDTQTLRNLEFDTWRTFRFWTTVGRPLKRVTVPSDLQSYHTYLNPGLPAGPIDSPTLASIQAALDPDVRGGYLYFYACPGKKTHLFARTLDQQTANINGCR